jgi:phthalate 4,5-dioxygenase
MALSREENALLTEVGADTLMGKLLRRYWVPACLSEELPEPQTALRVRLLGEDLVAFRNTEGEIGLIGEHCPHRGASLYFGRNEESGLRCVYHGWKFDVSGKCVDMPSEQRSFADRIRAISYPIHESGGIVWTYMGPPETITPFRDFGSDSLPEAEVRATKIHWGCNWVQVSDSNIDTAHASFLHRFNAPEFEPYDETDRPGYPSPMTALKIRYEDMAPRLETHDDFYGFRYAGIRVSPNGFEHVRISTWIMPWATQVANVPFATGQLLVVPIDDFNTFRYSYTTQSKRYERPSSVTAGGFQAVKGNPYYRNGARNGVLDREYTADNEYGMNRSVQYDATATGTFSGIPDHDSQDYMVTETMGPVYDRTTEHLGTTDLAIVRMHSMLLESARALDRDGTLPPGIGDFDFRGVRSAEKILEPGEDWRVLGTNDDPIVQQALLEGQLAGGPSTV